jgi:hypothetical protein
VLYGSDYWGGLIEWMRRTLSPRFADPEDLDIFRLVDTPQEAVRQVAAGVGKPWYQPEELAAADGAPKPPERGKSPLAGAEAADTGEGTVYGSRPKRTEKKHAKPERKPQQ